MYVMVTVKLVRLILKGQPVFSTRFHIPLKRLFKTSLTVSSPKLNDLLLSCSDLSFNNLKHLPDNAFLGHQELLS